MKCPAGQIELKMTERQGVEIDYCPQCCGVWLDRGELDKIIERSGPVSSPELREEYDDDERYDHRRGKRKSFWGQLFDFD
ncbi:MAG: zf-TFIIB domain-containing protein [Candidatus Tectomicrobia bacterium]|uniref:Zf-TFIIB domain-containing protein n=1 Tax=Tectimicrobiota bacterium TaxID=2528274 RepID=A0A933GPZ6_UNCTE|nr:zf-TFIIB domain-containing protein [Candidatus Tectomicrobia bacterium]